MKKIPTVKAQAPKLSGNGYIKYSLWIDGEGSIYVRMDENDGGGTLSELLFSVTEYAQARNKLNSIEQPSGYDLATNTKKISVNTNDGAFLKAVLLHLLPLRGE